MSRNIKRAWNYFKSYGFSRTLRRMIYEASGKDKEIIYSRWYKKTGPNSLDLIKQRFRSFKLKPKYGIVILRKDAAERSDKTLEKSLKKQKYKNYQIFDSGDAYESFLEAYDSGSVDFLIFADEKCDLGADALFEFTRILNEKRAYIKLLYSDHDELSGNSEDPYKPVLKPDYSPDLLRSVNYIGPLFVIYRSLLEDFAEGGRDSKTTFKQAFDYGISYDFILKCFEKAEQDDIELEKSGQIAEDFSDSLAEGRYTSATVYHVPKILYHWNFCRTDASTDLDYEKAVYDADARAISDHCERMGFPIQSIERGLASGSYHVKYKTDEPLVSVIIPNQDHIEDLDSAIKSLNNSEYKNLEFVVVENGSTEQRTRDYYRNIQREFKNVKVVRWDQGFNYSALNNLGAQHASGQYYLFLNNDIELINKDSVREMLMYAQRPDVGICGARLLYPDDTIQHAGVIVGMYGVAGPAFAGEKSSGGYMDRTLCTQDLSAVTAAALMCKGEIFEAAGGFSVDLAVAYNDVDFCMKVRALGKRIVYNPYALFHHYESKSRGLEDSPEKIKRFHREKHTFVDRWSAIVKYGDPYYNPQLTLRKADFSLRNLLMEDVGEPFPADPDDVLNME